MGALHSLSIKNIFYDKMDLRLFYFLLFFIFTFLYSNQGHLALLTHFWPMFLFYTSLKHQKTKDILVFSGSVK